MTTDKPCPTPTKMRYATLETADRRARFRSVQSTTSETFTAYECACGWFHLSTSTNDSYKCPDVRDLEGMVSLPFGDLQEVVLLDVKGRLPATMAEFLRHPRMLQRWRAELKMLASELASDLKRVPPDTERHRSISRLTNLTESRTREAYRLLMEYTGGSGAGVPGIPRITDPVLIENRTRRKLLRRTAGEIAVERLVVAHAEEFQRIFREEADKIGLVLNPFPDRLTAREAKDLGREDQN
jgi:hypothetical protein